MEFNGNGYKVTYDINSGAISFSGTFRCTNDEYAEMSKILEQVSAAKPAKIIIDLTSMEFLNSSGINMLAKFVINMRKGSDSSLEIKGSNSFPWQGKSLPNLKKLHPTLNLIMQ